MESILKYRPKRENKRERQGMTMEQKEYLSIDRIENGLAVCENDRRERIEIPLSEIDGDPKEGDMIYSENGRYRVSAEQTKLRREKILELQKRLFGE